jgi:hypothetical protein
MMPILTLDRLKQYINWHWFQTSCGESSSFLKEALYHAPPEFSALVYQQSHIECKNLWNNAHSTPLLIWLLTCSANQIKQFIQNIEVDGSGTDLVTLYPILSKMSNLNNARVRLFEKHYQKMVTYRSEVFPDVIANTMSSILISDLCRIVASYALPRLFWMDHPDMIQQFQQNGV